MIAISSMNSVLIIGAGPTGMTLAVELARRHIPVRVIDHREGHKPTSRSFTIHARTLELFDLCNLSPPLIASGIKSEGFIFNFKGKSAKPQLDCDVLQTTHPYVLLCNQNDTEDIMKNHMRNLGVEIEWNTEAVHMRTVPNNGYMVRMKNKITGEEEEREWDYVLGCDGVRSFVRQSCDIEYIGTSYEGMVMQMMDVPFSGFPHANNRIHYYMSKESFILISRLPGEKYRVIISKMGEGDTSLSKKEMFQRHIDEHVEGTTLGEPIWMTKWVIWKQLAEKYRAENAFLVGDAAHCHSPSGGQGMNVGMQDAINLAWKIAMVQKGFAKERLLDTYETERKPVGAQVIKGTDAMHDIVMAHGKGMQDRLELIEQAGWHDEAIERISGLSYHYRDIKESKAANMWLDGKVKPGDRVPDADLNGRKLYSMLKGSELLVVLLKSPDADETVNRIQKEIEKKWGRFTSTVEVNDDGDFAEMYGNSSEGTVWVIRPDAYVFGVWEMSSWHSAKGWMEQMFIS